MCRLPSTARGYARCSQKDWATFLHSKFSVNLRIQNDESTRSVVNQIRKKQETFEDALPDRPVHSEFM